ncbi:hypothetical protein QFC19_004198 [Naganishia cerealis]|uniref:Uncharacterized protein n=1 Tax=Naganishia cerealis TaxID=610337 RepID=A0ACC2VWU5_9TREE|nr:hypothetical protein QFC19_004198 [Naganishia cerealis]
MPSRNRRIRRPKQSLKSLLANTRELERALSLGAEFWETPIDDATILRMIQTARSEAQGVAFLLRDRSEAGLVMRGLALDYGAGEVPIQYLVQELSPKAGGGGKIFKWISKEHLRITKRNLETLEKGYFGLKVAEIAKIVVNLTETLVSMAMFLPGRQYADFQQWLEKKCSKVLKERFTCWMAATRSLVTRLKLPLPQLPEGLRPKFFPSLLPTNTWFKQLIDNGVQEYNDSLYLESSYSLEEDLDSRNYTYSMSTPSYADRSTHHNPSQSSAFRGTLDLTATTQSYCSNGIEQQPRTLLWTMPASVYATSLETYIPRSNSGTNGCSEDNDSLHL